MKKEEILLILDQSFLKKEMPLLDNGNFDFVKGRFSVFVGREDWLITIQIFGLSKLGPAIDCFAIGNQLNNKPSNTLLDFPFDFIDQHNTIIVDEEIEPGFTKNPIHIKLRDQFFEFHISESSQTQIKEENEWIVCLREMAKDQLFLERLWLTSKEQLELFNLKSSYTQLYTTNSWFHPESDKHLPSQNVFFQTVAESIVFHDSSIIKNEKKNTEWNLWAHTDSVEYY
ncbi:hypothetical protein AB0R75_11965 [Bacillus pumilus]|uniref:DUF7003 family protein n=1 Tax=Bacillus TaxID=1386 RepID=UPI002FFDE460